jgi:GNAT superfamily N-acetyltransferase
LRKQPACLHGPALPSRGFRWRQGAIHGEILGLNSMHPVQVTIRAAVEDDFPRWKPLWDGYNAFYGRAGTTALAPEVTRMTWLRFFDAYEPMHALVAEESGRLLGLVHFLFHRSTTQLAPSCYLQDLFTVEDARGRGIGRALIEAVYARALAAGSPRVYWQTHESNAVAMKLYDQVADKSGFVVYRKLL